MARACPGPEVTCAERLHECLGTLSGTVRLLSRTDVDLAYHGLDLCICDDNAMSGRPRAALAATASTWTARTGSDATECGQTVERNSRPQPELRLARWRPPRPLEPEPGPRAAGWSRQRESQRGRSRGCMPVRRQSVPRRAWRARPCTSTAAACSRASASLSGAPDATERTASAARRCQALVT
eukprot:3939827-Rhodomonas_salina.4